MLLLLLRVRRRIVALRGVRASCSDSLAFSAAAAVALEGTATCTARPAAVAVLNHE
jgi:hypothetical protein